MTLDYSRGAQPTPTRNPQAGTLNRHRSRLLLQISSVSSARRSTTAKYSNSQCRSSMPSISKSTKINIHDAFSPLFASRPPGEKSCCRHTRRISHIKLSHSVSASRLPASLHAHAIWTKYTPEAHARRPEAQTPSRPPSCAVLSAHVHAKNVTCRTPIPHHHRI